MFLISFKNNLINLKVNIQRERDRKRKDIDGRDTGTDGPRDKNKDTAFEECLRETMVFS